MPRRTPREDAVLAALRASCAELGLRGERVLVAISGGVDSTVLLHALAQLAPALGVEFAAGHVNHGLRGADADADEAGAADLAKALGVAFAVRRVAPRELRASAGSSRTRPTLQEAARKLRRAALCELAAELDCARVATAHTRDDQAETVLLRLLRGASPAGLGGISERSEDGALVRPLLGVSRAEVERYARERGLSWREDASNRDPHYARGKLRASGFSAFARSLNPEWLRAVAQLAEAQRKESAWIDELVKREAARLLRADDGGLTLSRAEFAALPEALARRLLRHALRELGGARDLSRAQLERSALFVRGARPRARLELAGGLVWSAAREHCRLARAPKPGSRC